MDILSKIFVIIQGNQFSCLFQVLSRLWSQEEISEDRTLQRLRESSGFTVTYLS